MTYVHRDISKTFIDGDIVAYRMAASADSNGYSFQSAAANVDRMIEDIIHEAMDFPGPSCFKVFLTGRGNFRYDIAKAAPYKGNRSGKPKPVYLEDLRIYMQEKWNAIVSEGEEADDLISQAVTQEGPTSCVASIDKDMLQLNCWHYNFVKRQWKFVDEFEGLHFFYSQILTGDNADNIIGLNNVGPVKAAHMLEGCTTEKALYQTCVKAYGGDKDRVVENGRLLWLRRQPEELWEPPNG
jgi:5'-3' exonuclease